MLIEGVRWLRGPLLFPWELSATRPLGPIPKPRFCIPNDGERGERGDMGEWWGDNGAFWGDCGALPLPPIEVWIVSGEFGLRGP